MSEFEELVTFAPDGSLVHLDGTPVAPLDMGSVTPNTLDLHRAEQDAQRRAIGARKASLHEKAMVRRRKRKRGGPR